MSLILPSPTRWKFNQRDAAGNLLWASGIGELEVERDDPLLLRILREQAWIPNALTDEGEAEILNVYFLNASAPAGGFYVGLINDAGIAETDTLATMVGEASGNGYARQLIERSATGFPTGPALDAGDMKITSSTETFTASGGTIGPVDNAILTDVSTGTVGELIAYVALSASRTLQDGDSLQTSFDIKAA